MINKQNIGLVLGPFSFIIILFIDVQGLSAEGRAVLASTAWIAIWWILESIPLAVTSLLPVILFPLTGGLDIYTTTTTYYSPMVMLFLGGFVIALAIEKWNLHQRIALNVIGMIGTNSDRIILGFMLATAFLSMWISNTATTLMMLPIGLAIARKMGDINQETKGNGVFAKALMLAIAYAASIGGMATLIGTPTNAIFSAMSIRLYDAEIGFGRWMLFGLPISVVLLWCAWVYLTKIAFRSRNAPGASEAGAARAEIQRQVRALGPMTYEEQAVTGVFVFTALAWITRSFLLQQILPGINDTVIAIGGAVLLFLVPAKGKGEKLMDWETAQKLPWGILLLFGGGLAIAAGFKTSGLAEWVGTRLADLDQLHFAFILVAVILTVNFFTEVTSNVATASVLLPVLASLSHSIGVHPFGLMVGACMAASCAFMLPVATPPNAIVYSSGALKMNDMVKTGIWMNLVSSTILFLCVYYLMPIIWDLDLLVYPW